jgi:hypothetical protein
MPRKKKDKPAEVEESFHALNARMTVKIRENILSGRWPAETIEEKRLLREHLAKQDKKKSKR